MKRSCFILFLVLLMVFPMSGCLQGDTEKENSLSHDETTTSSMSSVAIESSSPFPQFNKEFGKAESIHHSKDQDTLSIIYPVTDSEKVNAFLLDLMDKLTLEYSKEISSQDSSPTDTGLFVDYESFKKDEKIASFVFHVEEQKSHSAFRKKEIPVVYNMEEERELSLSDFFSQSELVKIRENAADRMNKEGLGKKYHLVPDGFFWEGDALHLLFSPADPSSLALPYHLTFTAEQLQELLHPMPPEKPESSVPEDSKPLSPSENSGLSGNKGKRIALTFDDGPGFGSTTRILNVLEKYHIKATFFVVGSNIAGREEQLVRMRQLGCDIGIHTYTHCNLNKATYDQVQSELQRTADAISNATGGYQPSLMRPPYGNANKEVLSWIPYPAIMWSVDTRDWESRDADAIMGHIQNDVSAGDIILMHEVYDSTAEAVERAIPWLLEQGYEFVSIPELIQEQGGELKAGCRYFSATNW